MIMNLLPDDIIKVIFRKLPFFNLPNCRIVCKAWNDVVLGSTSKFHVDPKVFLLYTCDIPSQPPHNNGPLQHLHPKMSCIDFGTTSFVASLAFDADFKYVTIYTFCNGLLYIGKRMSINFACYGIWNPMTNEFFEITESEPWKNMYGYGFGFNPKTKQYKLFRIIYVYGSNLEVINSMIEVWRFGISNQFEHLEHQPPFWIYGYGTYLDGVIYWLGYDITNVSVIYALDVETETFDTVAIPDLGPYFCAKLKRFKDTICLIVVYHLKMEVWIMRSIHSWNKECVIDLPIEDTYNFYRIKVFEDEGDIYFLVNYNLLCCGKNEKKIKMKTLFNPNETLIQDLVYLEALHFGSLSSILAGNH